MPAFPPATPLRPSERAPDQLRAVTIETAVNRYAEGSCLIGFGHTRVLVTASLEEGVPGFLRGKAQGWVTAEYGMLPRATHTRGRRGGGGGQAVRPHPGDPAADRTLAAGRGRHEGARRAADFSVDCDVIQADGGTRTAAITGAWVALRLCCDYLLEEKVIKTDPILDQVAAISCGVFGGTPVLDLDYEEDSNAEADANFVLTGAGDIVEIQATGEKARLFAGRVRTAVQPGAGRHRRTLRAPAHGRRALSGSDRDEWGCDGSGRVGVAALAAGSRWLATAVGAQAAESVLFVGNSYTFGALSPVHYYRSRDGERPERREDRRGAGPVQAEAMTRSGFPRFVGKNRGTLEIKGR